MSNFLTSESGKTVNVEKLFGFRVVYQNIDDFEDKVKRFQAAGRQNVAFISDFDFTMSKFHVLGGQRGASCYKILEDCNIINDEYQTQAQGLQRKYYPLEVDPELDEVTRLKHMEDWVIQANGLLIKYGLTQDIIKRAVASAIAEGRFELRPKMLEFFKLLKEHDIPLLIFSAGIAEILIEVLRNYLPLDDYLNSHVHVISNNCLFSNEPPHALADFTKPVIHVFNKIAKTFIDTSPFFTDPKIATRKHIILFGDSKGDVNMTDGMAIPREQILRVGFLNDRVAERLSEYQQLFDLVILDDPAMDIPCKIIEELLGDSDELLQEVASSRSSSVKTSYTPLSLSSRAPSAAAILLQGDDNEESQKM